MDEDNNVVLGDDMSVMIIFVSWKYRRWNENSTCKAMN